MQRLRLHGKFGDQLTRRLVDRLHPWRVEYLHAKTRISEPYRIAPGHSGLAHSANPDVGTAAWLWDQPGDSRELRRRPAGRDRLALPRLASPGTSEVDNLRMEAFREQTADQGVPSHCH